MQKYKKLRKKCVFALWCQRVDADALWGELQSNLHGASHYGAFPS
jgi:hypothetical protein